MRRVATTLGLALCVLGCAWLPRGEPVHLLTGDVRGMAERGECFLNNVVGRLVVDANYGTAIEIDRQPAQVDLAPVPVMWRPGFTGRRAGSEVEVLDREGNVVATTGRTYRIAGGRADKFVKPTYEYPWFACDTVIPK